ncbi:hypothetical protein KGF54_002729 [Candida jiufengensis]|uniref:uncharacterized protein n=1 Tax=Candida jiufengensis TaxID=497108 RepID=UPI002224FDDE|nr:uncharacterized protein KGF54_002729 [Candida jiufengensis]KAI5953358.1 hypothetical protein KGF54_002729 [Candida jiufengensis]
MANNDTTISPDPEDYIEEENTTDFFVQEEEEDDSKPSSKSSKSTNKDKHRKINIKITDPSKFDLELLVPWTSKLGKAMEIYCKRREIEFEAHRFLLDGTRVLPHHTPEDLELVDGDEIQVLNNMYGGGG